MRCLSTKVLWLQQLVKPGIVMVSACTSAENCADLGTKSLPIHKLRLLRQLNGLALNGIETSANGDGEDGQNETGKRGAAVQTISNSGQGDGGLLEAQENLLRAVRGMKRVSGHRCSMQCEKWLTRSMMTIRAALSGCGKMA